MKKRSEIIVADSNAQEQADAMQAARLVGRIEALTFTATVADSAALEIYEQVKKSKGWRLMKGRDGAVFSGIEEFAAEVLGKSGRRLQEIAANRRTLGSEAFEQAERLGLRQRDYNAIRALPAPDQELIRRAAEEAKDREEVLALMHDLAAESAKAKQDYEGHIRSLESDLADTEQQKARAAVNFQDEIDRLKSKVQTLQESRYQNPDFSPATNLVRQKASVLADHVVASLEQLAKLTAEVIDDNGSDVEMQLASIWWSYRECMAHLCEHTEQFSALTDGFHIDVDTKVLNRYPAVGFNAAEAREFIAIHTAIRTRIDSMVHRFDEEPQKPKRGRPRKTEN